MYRFILLISFAMLTGCFDGMRSQQLEGTEASLAESESGISIGSAEDFSSEFPSQYDFGNVVLGESSERNIEISNIGNGKAQGLVINVTGSGFSVSSNTCPSDLKPGEVCQVDVRFSPGMEKVYQGEIIVTTRRDSAKRMLRGVGVLESDTPTPTTTTSTTSTTTSTSTTTTSTSTSTSTTTSTTLPTSGNPGIPYPTHEPEGMQEIYHNDGRFADLSNEPAWRVSDRWLTHTELIEDPTNPTGSGYSIQKNMVNRYDADTYTGGGGNAYMRDFNSVDGVEAESFKKVYIRLVKNKNGNDAQPNKQFYLGTVSQLNCHYPGWNGISAPFGSNCVRAGGNFVHPSETTSGNNTETQAFYNKLDKWVIYEYIFDYEKQLIEMYVDGVRMKLAKRDANDNNRWVVAYPDEHPLAPLYEFPEPFDGFLWYFTFSHNVTYDHTIRVGELYISAMPMDSDSGPTTPPDSAAVYSEPTGSEWTTIYYNNGTDDDPVNNTGAGLYGPRAWTDDRGDGSGRAIVESISDAQAILDGYGPNPNGSGYSLEFHHPAESPGGANYQFKFNEFVDHEAFGEVYIRMVINWGGNPAHGEKFFYLGHSGDRPNNDWYPTMAVDQSTDKLMRMGFRDNMVQNQGGGINSDLVVKDSDLPIMDYNRTGFGGKESGDVVVEWQLKMSSSIGVCDGAAKIHVDGILLTWKNYYGYNQPYDLNDGYTITGLCFWDENVALSNAWDGFLWQGAIQNTYHNNYNHAHTKVIRELKIMGLPARGNDGTSWQH